MTDIQIDAGTLRASADDDTATGLLVPYGVEARSNLGRFTAEAGSFTIPEDVTGHVLNVEHDREQPVGAVTRVWEQPEGLFASFRFSKSPEGQAALADARSGKRSSLSVEASGVIIRAGKAIAGRIFAAALVERPAFAGATLLAAEDTGDADRKRFEAAARGIQSSLRPAYVSEPDEGAASFLAISRLAELAGSRVGAGMTFLGSLDAERDADVRAFWESLTDDQRAELTRIATPETPSDEDSTSEEEHQEETQPITETEEVVNSTLPATLEASKAAPLTVAQVGSLYARRATGQMTDLEFSQAIDGQNGNTLFGALSDVKYDGTGGLAPTMTAGPQWLGQVWQATTYRQQVLPLFAHGDLTSLTFGGFKLGTKPSGGDWAGNKAAVNSNTLTVSPVSGTASRYSIGHDISREFVDFPVDGFFEAYAAGVSEDYARWADNKVAAAVIAGATTSTGDALTTLPGGTNNIGSAASAIIDGAIAMVTVGTLPDFALVSVNLWKQLAKQPQSNVMGYLNAALGLSDGSLEGFTIRPSAAVANGKVLVGARSAVTVLELPGSPIRIDALDLARGGVDKAAFGYLGVNVNDALGLQLVTAAVS